MLHHLTDRGRVTTISFEPRNDLSGVPIFKFSQTSPIPGGWSVGAPFDPVDDRRDGSASPVLEPGQYSVDQHAWGRRQLSPNCLRTFAPNRGRSSAYCRKRSAPLRAPTLHVPSIVEHDITKSALGSATYIRIDYDKASKQRICIGFIKQIRTETR